MARFRCRPDTGALYFDFTYRGVRCREQTSLTDTPANRKAMAQMLQRIEAAMADGSFEYATFFPNSPRLKLFASDSHNRHGGSIGTATLVSSDLALPTFGDFAERFFREQAVGWRANTRDWMRWMFDTHLLPAFRDRRLDAISREDVLGFRVRLAERRGRSGKPMLSPKTINVLMRVLKAVMTEAAERYGLANPTAGIKRLKVRKHDVQPFTLDEVRRLLDSVRPDYRPYLTVAFFTGMRPGELNGLKWTCVDFDAGQILVRETFTKGRTEYTKTDGSQREILMSPPVREALLTQQTVSRPISEYVFCTRDGTPLNAKNFADRVWYPLLRHLDLPRRVPYQTRHTAATLWLAAGENPEWIARQLGHTTTEMLFRVYSRYVPNLTRKDGSAFDRLLTAALNDGVTEAAAGRAANDPAGPTDTEVRHG